MPGGVKRFCLYPGCSALVERGMCDKHRTRQRYCLYPGCNQIVTDSNWCAAHQPAKRHDQKRGLASARGYDRSWQLVRAAYMAQYPLCGRCQMRGLVNAADMVHHIVAISDGGERFANGNLISLCWSCHGKVGPGGDSVAVVMSYKQTYQSGQCVVKLPRRVP